MWGDGLEKEKEERCMDRDSVRLVQPDIERARRYTLEEYEMLLRKTKIQSQQQFGNKTNWQEEVHV